MNKQDWRARSPRPTHGHCHPLQHAVRIEIVSDYLLRAAGADNGGRVTAFVKDGGSQTVHNFLDILYKRGAAGTANANRVLYYIRLKPEFVACGANTNCINSDHTAKLTIVGGSSFVRGDNLGGADPDFDSSIASYSPAGMVNLAALGSLCSGQCGQLCARIFLLGHCVHECSI